MSRSYKKHPIEKWSDSEKDYKQSVNRKFRRKNKQKDYEDDDLLIKTYEITNNHDKITSGSKRYLDNPETKRK